MGCLAALVGVMFWTSFEFLAAIKSSLLDHLPSHYPPPILLRFNLTFYLRSRTRTSYNINSSSPHSNPDMVSLACSPNHLLFSSSSSNLFPPSISPSSLSLVLFQKIKTLSRSLDNHAPSKLGDAAPQSRNLDPNLHPFDKPREYTRALNAAKLDRLFAKPFVASLDGHIDGVYSLATDLRRLNFVASGSGDGGEWTECDCMRDEDKRPMGKGKRWGLDDESEEKDRLRSEDRAWEVGV